MTGQEKYQWAVQFLNRYYPNFKDAEKLYNEQIASLVGKNIVFLEAGCGKGVEIRRYGNRVKLAVGVDIDQESIKEAGQEVQNLVVANLEKLPFKEETFDLIGCRWILEHLSDPPKVFEEFNRTLKKNGRLLAVTPNIYNYASVISRFTPLKIKKVFLERLGRGESETFPTYYRCNSISRLLNIAQRTGFVKEELVLVGNPFYLFFSKPLFILGVAYEKLTDLPFLRRMKLHIVARLVKK